MLFHDAIAQALAEHGVTTVFGVLGDANLYMMDSFQRNAGGHYYSASNENGAVLAANGYARTSGQLGVCTVTHGPAFTNTLTALTQGVREHTPLLLLAGDTPAAERANLQDIAQRPVALAAGAGFEQVRAPQTVFEDLATAIQRAWSESRPIVLNVPVDFQWEEIEYQSVPSRLIGAQAVRPDPAALDAAVGIIASARRPVVLAGWGATSPDARAALLRLADRLGAPVATTLRGKGLFTGERFNLGIHGTLAHAVALDTLNSSDCLIAFGAGLNRWTTADGSLLAKKRVVQVDVSRDSINRWAVADAGVIGDAAITADTIVTMLDEAGVKPTGFASPELAERLAAGTGESFTDRSTDESVDLRTALDMIDRAFPADRTLVLDIGRFIRHGLTRLSAPEPSAFVHTLDFGAIGLGMPTAVGAAFGRPGHPVLMVAGDGGFMLGGLAEFSMAVRHKTDMVVFVMNDHAYGAEYIQFRNKNMDPTISTFDWPDLGPVGTALGGEGYTVRNLKELEAVLAAVPNRTKPMLVDVKLDPAVQAADT